MNENLKSMHNKVLENVEEKFNNTIDEIAKKAIDNANELLIIPINQYVLVKPYDVNPYTKIKISDGGLAMNTAEHKIFNSDKGEEELADIWERVGSVVEVSPLCKFVKEGDDIFYRKGQAVPVAFLGLGLETVAENQILVVINKDLKDRFKNIK